MYNDSDGYALFESYSCDLLEDVVRYINYGTFDQYRQSIMESEDIWSGQKQ